MKIKISHHLIPIISGPYSRIVYRPVGNITDNNTPDFESRMGLSLSFCIKVITTKYVLKNNNDYKVYLDPGVPPYYDAPINSEGLNDYKSGFAMVSVWGSHLDSNDDVLWDISPGAIGNLDFEVLSNHNVISNYNYLDGGDFSLGHQVNPITGNVYQSNMVKRGDYTRVLASFGQMVLTLKLRQGIGSQF